MQDMPTEDRRARERAARHRLIIDTARRVAEAEGWDAVTTRRLSSEIEYSQPVLYKHFSGMDQVAAAVALDGFGELSRQLRAVRADAATPADALTRMARAYLDFARDNAAVYDAMFTGRTTLRFAAEDTPPELVGAFDRAAPGGVRGRQRSGRGHPDRGVLGCTARTGHPWPRRPATSGLRPRAGRSADRPVPRLTKSLVSQGHTSHATPGNSARCCCRCTSRPRARCRR